MNNLTNIEQQERAVLLGVLFTRSDSSEDEANRSLAELEELCLGCGAEVVAQALQKRPAPDAAYYAGKGKIIEMAELARQLEANCLIIDAELSGSQMRNIAELSQLKVLDRTLLILDIFARRAQSSEGVLQVEIAQLEDRLSRLTGSGQALSRLGGGIGTRGPGESKLESDRRHIRRRISHLKAELHELEARRERHRERRKERLAISVAVCGYTNAGKSSLVNLLCQSELYACDQLFATLDLGARRLVGKGPEVILLDTVGFIRNLPHHLVEAFRSTLDELAAADIVLQVTDISDPDCQAQMELMEKMLQSLGAADTARIHVLNKADLCPEIPPGLRLYRQRLDRDIPEYIVSVKTTAGIDLLLNGIRELIEQDMPLRELLLPYDKYVLSQALHEHGIVEAEEHTEQGLRIRFRIPKAKIGLLQDLA